MPKRNIKKRPRQTGKSKMLKLTIVISGRNAAAIAQAIREFGSAARDDERKLANPEVGDEMPDGSVFAGMVECEDQAPYRLYAAPADEPLTLTFNESKGCAEDKSKDTGKAYRVPSALELNVLFKNRMAIGGFDLTGSYPSGWYWSSSPDYCYDDFARVQRFSGGNQYFDYKRNGLSVRLVRS